MDALLREFWAAWKRWDGIRRVERGVEHSGYARPLAWQRMIAIAERVEALERQAARAPCVGKVPDVPGQMFLTDLPPAESDGCIPLAKAMGVVKKTRRRRVSA